MKRLRIISQVTVLLCLSLANAAWSQTAVVRRNSNLRPEPSMVQAPLRVLMPPETVTLPGSEFRNGYYRVQTEKGETGWAWSRNLKVTSAAAPGEATTSQVQALQATNLRADPSTRQAPVGLVEPGANLLLLMPEPQSGYYKVRAPDGREGWIWSQNVAVVGKGGAAVPPPAVPAAPPPPPPPAIEKPKAAPTVAVAPVAVPTVAKIAATPTERREEAVAPAATATQPAAPPPTATEKAVEAAPRVPEGAGLKPGDTLDRNTAHLAKGLLPPEILGHYERGEYTNKIVAFDGNPNWEKGWNEATKENASRLTIDEQNTIIDKTTGKQPAYFYGIPFPNIDEKDPTAGAKIVWNQFLSTWYGGNSHTRVKLAMLNPKGLDRELIAESWFQFYDGQSPRYRHPNPLDLSGQFLAVALAPADTQGTASLSWRYRDPATRDAQWAFVPALRRVRAISPANRSDGFLGSDISADDGFFFDGKPQDFTWKLVAKQDGLRIIDPEVLNGSVKPRPATTGSGWETQVYRPNIYGYEIAGWTGLPWALPSSGLARRPMYVVEGTPKDKYYLYGKIVLWVDAETYDGAWHQKFSWTGEHVLTYQLTARVNVSTPAGDESVVCISQPWAVAENFKMRRASLGGAHIDSKAPYQRRNEIDPSIFEAGALMRFGK